MQEDLEEKKLQTHSDGAPESHTSYSGRKPARKPRHSHGQLDELEPLPIPSLRPSTVILLCCNGIGERSAHSRES